MRLTRTPVRRIVAALGVLAAPETLASQPADSARAERPPPVIGWVDIATLGVGVAGSIALMNADTRVARELQSDRLQQNARYQDIAHAAAKVNEKSLFAVGLVTYGVARLARAPRTTTDIALHTTESIFIASATATVVRGILGRSRPFVTAGADSRDYKPGQGFRELKYRAYPSIHAAASYATASALTAEARRRSKRAAWIVGPISYGLATTPGLARMYADKHWASDVAMGMALGAVSGWATVRYHHHRPGNRFDRILLGPSPTVTADGAVGLAWTFTL
jgi:membrane-associated phospholipid phosphatase